MAMTLDGSNGVTFNDASLQGAAASPYVLKNRIINGAMVIDQRNAGASGTASAFTIDRWGYSATQSSKGTWQQNAGSVTPPTGFSNYWGFTSSSAYSVTASDQFYFYQGIEGYNVADMGFGAAGASTFTISFWVRSSLTGTFGASVQNASQNRSYPFSYTISSANTWEQKTVTIVGDTSGTWLKTNGCGMYLLFGLGVGSTFSGTAGAWAGSNFVSATGATSVVGTNGATWYVTGVQLEIGTSATPFERRLYNQELANCQRYYWKTYLQSVVAGTSSNLNGAQIFITNNISTIQPFNFTFPVCMRASPTCTPYSISGTSGRNSTSSGLATYTDQTASVSYVSESGAYVAGNNGSLNGFYALVHLVASSEI